MSPSISHSKNNLYWTCSYTEPILKLKVQILVRQSIQFVYCYLLSQNKILCPFISIFHIKILTIITLIPVVNIQLFNRLLRL